MNLIVRAKCALLMLSNCIANFEDGQIIDPWIKAKSLNGSGIKMKILILISVIYCIGVADCTLISQSIIEECILDDSSEPSTDYGTTCGKKIVVSVTLRSGQVKFVLLQIVHCILSTILISRLQLMQSMLILTQHMIWKQDRMES